MSNTFLSPCPNHGKCGSMQHRPDSQQFQECLRMAVNSAKDGVSSTTHSVVRTTPSVSPSFDRQYDELERSEWTRNAMMSSIHNCIYSQFEHKGYWHDNEEFLHYIASRNDDEIFNRFFALEVSDARANLYRLHTDSVKEYYSLYHLMDDNRESLKYDLNDLIELKDKRDNINPAIDGVDVYRNADTQYKDLAQKIKQKYDEDNIYGLHELSVEFPNEAIQILDEIDEYKKNE